MDPKLGRKWTEEMEDSELGEIEAWKCLGSDYIYANWDLDWQKAEAGRRRECGSGQYLPNPARSLFYGGCCLRECQLPETDPRFPTSTQNTNIHGSWHGKSAYTLHDTCCFGSVVE